MDTDVALQDVAVVGAAGKMGSGIALLLLQQMTYLSMSQKQAPFSLKLVDINESGFSKLQTYLDEQLLKYAEKNIIALRQAAIEDKKLVSNAEVIQYFLESARKIVSCTTNLNSLKNTKLIFEAIIEDLSLKVKMIKEITLLGNDQAFFFTNTSSIPIHIIEKQAHIENRLIGYHFYNPPAVQKLLEIIIPNGCSKELIKIAEDLSSRLKKIIVVSQDIAGFIGNGHMIREMVFANQKVKELQKKYSLEESIYIVNSITEKKLIRPMGIFQLMDYVGLDVCLHIANVMKTYLKSFNVDMQLLETLLKRGIKGGQTGDSVQKNGFFEYEKNQISKIYFFDEQKYVDLKNISWKKEIDEKVSLDDRLSFKSLLKIRDRDHLIKNHLKDIVREKKFDNEITKEFIDNSYQISQNLVQDGVSKDLNDVDKVLFNGFYHLFGNSQIKELYR